MRAFMLMKGVHVACLPIGGLLTIGLLAAEPRLNIGGAPQAAAGPVFEAASVKRRAPGGPTVPMLMIVTPGRIHFQAVSLRDCIRWAYGLAEYQITGGPAWIERTLRWDIDAKADGPATDHDI